LSEQNSVISRPKFADQNIYTENRQIDPDSPRMIKSSESIVSGEFVMAVYSNLQFTKYGQKSPTDINVQIVSTRPYTWTDCPNKIHVHVHQINAPVSIYINAPNVNTA
jgi:hypothetical protein